MRCPTVPPLAITLFWRNSLCECTGSAFRGHEERSETAVSELKGSSSIAAMVEARDMSSLCEERLTLRLSLIHI